jgi:hypothetical protein
MQSRKLFDHLVGRRLSFLLSDAVYLRSRVL